MCKMKLFNQFIGASAIAIGTMGAASATCLKDNKPVACPPPVYNPIPSTTPTGSTPVYNNNNNPVNNNNSAATSQSGATAGAVSGSSSTSGASAGIKTGDIGSTSGVTTGAIGSSSSAKAGDSNSSAKTGDVNVDGSNNSQYSSSTTYKAAAASAISGGAGNMGHGCFRGKGGFSLGLQTVAGGASVTIGGGEEYEISKIKTIDAQGNEVEIEGNLCAIDQINQSTIAAGATPYATNGQIRLGALTAAKASPDVGRAMAEIATVSTLFDRQATGGASAPVSNTYQTVIVDKAGVTTTIECPKCTKPVLNKNGVPVVDKSTGEPVCQPG